jgi:hypothetical protein
VVTPETLPSLADPFADSRAAALAMLGGAGMKKVRPSRPDSLQDRTSAGLD